MGGVAWLRGEEKDGTGECERLRDLGRGEKEGTEEEGIFVADDGRDGHQRYGTLTGPRGPKKYHCMWRLGQLGQLLIS